MDAARRTRRIVAYDAMRAFAIVTVVGIHTLMPYRELVAPTAAVRVFDDLLHYAVPLFVFMSGALLWSRPWHGGPGAYHTFLIRRAAVIGAPYLAWSALFLALRAATEPVQWAELPGMLLSGHTWYHLYFVPMLLTFYLLTPVSARMAQRWPGISVLAAYALRIVPETPVAERVGAVLGNPGWAWATHVVTHLPHMALGAWFALTYPRWPAWTRRSWPLLLAAGTVVLTAASLGMFADWSLYARRLVYPIGMAVTVIGFALLAFELEPWLERASTFFTRAGALAFGVFFVHPLFLEIVFRLAERGPGARVWLRAPWLAVATFVSVTALSFASAWLLSRHRSTAWLVGLRASSRDSG